MSELSVDRISPNAGSRVVIDDVSSETANISAATIEQATVEGGNITGHAIAFIKQVISFNISYDIDLSLGSYIATYDIGTATAITVNAPTNPIIGQKMVLDWTTGTSSGDGDLDITWDSIFKADSYVTMSANKRVIMEFIYDGANWLLIGTPTELTP